MSLRILHSSDWHIGKVFGFVDDGTMGLLQEARLAAIDTLGKLAVRHHVSHILVAGDVYDMEKLDPRSLMQPLERMRKFAGVTWHLLPGNHDPYRPHGLWDQLRCRGVPDNVILHLSPEPGIFDHFAILPAPLRRKRTSQDPTAYMDHVETPDGMIRLGLAHGTVRGSGPDEREVANYIDPARPISARLAYLALGDWHGQKKINDRVWYSGAPEYDSFRHEGGGRALLVEIDNADSPPVLTPLETGHYRWKTVSHQISSREDVDALATALRNSSSHLNRILLALHVEGAVSLEDRQYFEEQIMEQVAAAFCSLRVDDKQLFSNPTQADLDRIDRGGFVRKAAEVLKQKAEDRSDPDHEIAALALRRLYVEHMKLQTGSQ